MIERKHGSNIMMLMRMNKINQITFNTGKNEYTISAYPLDGKNGRMNVINSRGTQLQARIYGESESNYYITIDKGSTLKNADSVVIDKATWQIVEILKWSEMQEKYLASFFRRTQTNNDRIKELQAKQAVLYAEIAKLQEEIDKLK